MIYFFITMTVLIGGGIFINKSYFDSKKEKDKTAKKLEFEIGPIILK